MSFQYLEKLLSKLKSFTLTDERTSADVTKRASNDHVNGSRDRKNKSVGSKHAKVKSLKKDSKMDEEVDEETGALHMNAEPMAVEDDRWRFTMSASRSQPSPKAGKSNSESKKKKLKAKDTTLIKEKIAKEWKEPEGSRMVGKIKKKWGWEKREGELVKKLGMEKASKEERCKTKEGSSAGLEVWECDNGNQLGAGKFFAENRKRKQKPNTAPHLTDSLIVYKERFNRKSERYDYREEDAKEFPTKKEGKGVSFSEDMVHSKGAGSNEEESLISLYHNFIEQTSACGLTKEQFEKIKRFEQKLSLMKKKLL